MCFIPHMYPLGNSIINNQYWEHEAIINMGNTKQVHSLSKSLPHCVITAVMEVCTTLCEGTEEGAGAVTGAEEGSETSF